MPMVNPLVPSHIAKSDSGNKVMWVLGSEHASIEGVVQRVIVFGAE